MFSSQPKLNKPDAQVDIQMFIMCCRNQNSKILLDFCFKKGILNVSYSKLFFSKCVVKYKLTEYQLYLRNKIDTNKSRTQEEGNDV